MTPNVPDTRGSQESQVAQGDHEIVTQRLSLTRLRPDDAAALFTYRSDPAVARYQTWLPASLEEVRAFIGDQQSAAFDTPGEWSQLGLRLIGSPRLVGDAGIRIPADRPDEAEIGITIAPEHQGRGLATEAVAALLDHLFVVLGKRRVSASVDPRNLASVAVLTKVGMHPETYVPESVQIRGEWVDDLVFALLQAEWRSRPAPSDG